MLFEFCLKTVWLRAGITSATMKEIEKSPHTHVYSMHREVRVSRVVVQFCLDKTHQSTFRSFFGFEVTRQARKQNKGIYNPRPPCLFMLSDRRRSSSPDTLILFGRCDFDGQREREHAGTGAGRQEHAATRHPR
jgi:hypothetical protein